MNRAVECVVLAEFDIDKGSCIRAKYPPNAISDEEDFYLAEQMLPDGSERHAQPTSCFILNRPAPPSNARIPCKVYRMSDDEASSSWRRVSRQSRDVVHVDSVAGTIRLECGPAFSTPPCDLSPSVAVHLHPSMPAEVTEAEGLPAKEAGEEEDENGPRFALLKLGTELVGLLFASEAHYSDLEKVLTPPAKDDTGNEVEGKKKKKKGELSDVLFGFNFVMTKKDVAARRGGVTKAIAICGKELSHLEPLRSIVLSSLSACLDVPSDVDQSDIIASLFHAINEFVSPALKKAQEATSQLQANVQCFIDPDGSPPSFEVKCGHGGKLYQCTLPIFPTRLETALWTPSITKLVKKLKASFFHLTTAILCEKRIVVIGRHCPAEEVCDTVLALGALGSAVFPQFIAHRVFPYTSINCMDRFQLVPGFIVGTMNPMFDNRKEWWDVLLDLDASTVTVNTMCKSLIEDSSCAETDEPVLAHLTRTITRMKYSLASDDRIELALRRMIGDHLKLLMLCAAFPDNCPERWQRTLVGPNTVRLLAAQLGANFDDFKERFDHAEVVTFLTIAQIRLNDTEEDYEMLQLLQTLLRRTKTESDLFRMLLEFPSCYGGFLPLSTLLFHPSAAVRLMTVTLFRRVESFAVGRHCVSKLNGFAMLALEQLKRDFPDTSNAYT